MVRAAVDRRGSAEGGSRGGDRMGALDGIRGVAMVAIIAYHTGIPWLTGAYYSVDAFFVLSGFLITSLLVREWDRSGDISLGGFWARRARRLLPALFLMLFGVACGVALLPWVLPAPRLVGDTVAAVLYVANWHLAFEHASYFAASAKPSPLLHTWTLAVEEQFYLVWPLVVSAIMRLRHKPDADPFRVRKRRLNVLLFVAVAGASASAIWMAVLAPESGDPSRAYYGSDTRAQALLIGAALAVVLARRDGVRTAAGRRAVSAVGLAGAFGIALLWSRVAYNSHLAFHGGFTLMALAAAAVCLAAAQAPRSPLSRVLALRPLRAVGRISSGMYLGYWPTLLVLTGERTGLHGYALFGARVAVVTAIAAASFVLIERPIQQGLFEGWRGLIAIPLGAVTTSMVAVTAVPAAASATGSLRVVHVAGAAAAQPFELPSRSSTTVPAAPRAPVRILFVGDSMSGSLAVGVGAVAGRYGAEVVARGEASCAPTMDDVVRIKTDLVAPKAPCVPGNPDAVIADMGAWVRQYDPDVVVYMARADLFDDDIGGRWSAVGQPVADGFIAAQLNKTVAVLGSQGARVVLVTDPPYASGEQENGTAWPEDGAARVAADNALLRQVAAAHAADTVVVDGGSLLGPSANAQAGMPVRCPDGVHVDPAGGAFFGSRVLPMLTGLGRAHADAHAAQRAPLGPEPLLPPWWNEIQCGSG